MLICTNARLALPALLLFAIVSNAFSFQPRYSGGFHFSQRPEHLSHSGHASSHGGPHSSHGGSHSFRAGSQFSRGAPTTAPSYSIHPFSHGGLHSSSGGDHSSHGGSRFSEGGFHDSHAGFTSAPSQSAHVSSHGGFHSSHGGFHSSQAASTSASHMATSSTAAGLNPNIASCQLALPANALTAEGLSTPWKLLPPCSQAVSGQQAFAEAAVIDANGQISIYHPLIIDQGNIAQVAPVVPDLGSSGALVALFFGFNGDTLTLVDSNGQDSNNSPALQALQCVNGAPGVQGDTFGQVSFCNADRFWRAANTAVANGQLHVPSLGTDKAGKQCPSTRSFEIIDQDQSDNLPTKYLLLQDGSTIQFTADNQANFPDATEIDNASDEALIAAFVDPAIGCTPFQVPSLDDPGTKVSALATQELQALIYQQKPVALIPLNDPQAVLTASGAQSAHKVNAFRRGVNQPLLGTASNTDEGSGNKYCNNLVEIQPPFLAAFQNEFTNTMTPAADVGNNLFTFLANRFLQSLTNLGCQNHNVPVTYQLFIATARLGLASSTHSPSLRPLLSTQVLHTQVQCIKAPFITARLIITARVTKAPLSRAPSIRVPPTRVPPTRVPPTTARRYPALPIKAPNTIVPPYRAISNPVPSTQVPSLRAPSNQAASNTAQSPRAPFHRALFI